MKNKGCIKVCLLLLFYLAFSNAKAQTYSEQDAYNFFEKCRSVIRLDSAEIDEAIDLATKMIEGNRQAGTFLGATMGQLYVTRAMLLQEKLERQGDIDLLKAPVSELYLKAESDYKAAIHNCDQCACDYYSSLLAFYETCGNEEGVKETERKMEEMGIDEWPSTVGFGLSYMAPKNIVGAEVCIMGYEPFHLKRKRDPDTHKRKWPCGYSYPAAVGLVNIGFETMAGGSLSAYNGVKISPFWVNGIVSLRVGQFLYCNSTVGNSFVWRPEAGLSFSTISVSYAYNHPFKSSFNTLPPHSITVHVYIPTFKF